MDKLNTLLGLIDSNTVNNIRNFLNDSGDEPKKLTVESVSNHVYFYAHVDSDRGLALMRELREKDQDLRNERLSRDIPDTFPHTPIWLHINSGGGELFTGFALADQIPTIKTPIYSIVEGYCASAATLISMSCTERFIRPSSFMLIHQLSDASWGTYSQLQDDQHLRDMAMERLYNFYSKKSHIEIEKVKEYLTRDSWFNATESLELGLADRILE